MKFCDNFFKYLYKFLKKLSWIKVVEGDRRHQSFREVFGKFEIFMGWYGVNSFSSQLALILVNYIFIFFQLKFCDNFFKYMYKFLKKLSWIKVVEGDRCHQSFREVSGKFEIFMGWYEVNSFSSQFILKSISYYFGQLVLIFIIIIK